MPPAGARRRMIGKKAGLAFLGCPGDSVEDRPACKRLADMAQGYPSGAADLFGVRGDEQDVRAMPPPDLRRDARAGAPVAQVHVDKRQRTTGRHFESRFHVGGDAYDMMARGYEDLLEVERDDHLVFDHQYMFHGTQTTPASWQDRTPACARRFPARAD